MTEKANVRAYHFIFMHGHNRVELRFFILAPTGKVLMVPSVSRGVQRVSPSTAIVARDEGQPMRRRYGLASLSGLHLTEQRRAPD